MFNNDVYMSILIAIRFLDDLNGYLIQWYVNVLLYLINNPN